MHKVLLQKMSWTLSNHKLSHLHGVGTPRAAWCSVFFNKLALLEYTMQEHMSAT